MRRSKWTFCIFWLVVSLPVFAATRFLTGFEVESAESGGRISISIACKAQIVGEETSHSGDRLQLRLDVTTLCRGSAPSVAKSYLRMRPKGSDDLYLADIEYDGSTVGESLLTLNFERPVQAVVTSTALTDQIVIRIEHTGSDDAVAAAPRTTGAKRVVRETQDTSKFVINLSSSRRPHAMSDVVRTNSIIGKEVYETSVELPNGTWYRLRVGEFRTIDAAEAAARELASAYPSAWVDRVAPGERPAETQATFRDDSVPALPDSALSGIGLDQVDEIMSDARAALQGADYSRAVQLYTKVLRIPSHDRHAEAQEMLGLTRERNGQNAHAKAEYEKYLFLYPDSTNEPRVRQRLASLVAVDRNASVAATTPGQGNRARGRASDSWTFQTFLSQFYRRDVNQPSDTPELVSQSAIYSDINFDARKRGERFDLSSRVSVGYRHDMLGADGSGNDWRVNYAYFDIDDNDMGMRGRVGRQTRHSGGVLGRFDGVNAEYDLGDWFTVGGVAGTPVYSTVEGADTNRFFYGLSVNYSPNVEGLEVGAYALEQRISSKVDRQVIGGELRWFAARHSVWGMVDFDTEFGKTSSAFLQGNWRPTDSLTIHASFDSRHSPFLSLGSAITGQPVTSFDELLVIFTEPELRQLSLDRSPKSRSTTLGLSQAISPRLQLGLDINQTKTDAAPESGGVAATLPSTFRYFSSHLTANSLLFEGDTMIFSLRASDSETSKVYSAIVDTRFPISRRWRINPRIRVDYRDFAEDGATEWQFIPGLRVQYRHSQRFRFDFEGGKLFADRESATSNLERGSYFVTAGYQLFFR